MPIPGAREPPHHDMTNARLLVATTNPGKLAEIARALAGAPVTLLSLVDTAPVAEPAEHGATFAEIARDKARHYARATGLATVAEDSGLEIDALDGAPGVLSARFPGATYPDKFARIFAMLDERGVQDSPARFVCALAVARDDEVLFEAEGRVEGWITREPRGGGGFGYDPILYYPPYGRTLAEVSADEKAAVSHRGQAFRALRAWLEGGGLEGRRSREGTGRPVA
jgi:XTP/dITP diphosphohydrolase